jgi:hypothetical protein
MHNASGKHLQAGLLALDADQSPSRSPRSEQWLMTEAKMSITAARPRRILTDFPTLKFIT